MHRNGYLWATGQKSDHAICSGDLDFLWNGYNSTMRLRFRNIFDVFMHDFHLTLWPWPSTFWRWRCLTNKELDTSNAILASYNYLFLSYVWLNLIALPSSGMVTAHVTWPVHRVSPKTTCNNFWPQLIYSLYNFYGATTTMTIKGSFILEHPMLKRFSAAKSPVKIGPEMAVFRKFKSINIKYSYRDLKKALPYPERRPLTYFS